MSKIKVGKIKVSFSKPVRVPSMPYKQRRRVAKK
jgi:hypothetical protein